MGIQGEEEREKGSGKNIELIMVENFWQLTRDTKPQSRKVWVNTKNYAKAYHLKTSENQRPRENLGKKPEFGFRQLTYRDLRVKIKSDFRKHATKNKMEWNI